MGSSRATVRSTWVDLWAAARYTGVEPGDLLVLADTGWLPAYRFGGRCIRFTLADLEPLLPLDP